MSAEALRRAAALIRERAEAATPAPWLAFTAKKGGGYVHGVTTGLDEDYESDLFVGSTRGDAIHIASWHPAVALAVAEWLDAEAENPDPCHASTPADCYVRDCSTHRALTVARAYLRDGGEDRG